MVSNTVVSLLVASGEGPPGLLPARQQMAFSLGWHIVLACFGVAFPAMIYVVHRRGLVREDSVALGLAKRWATVSAILFAIGAVSGTVLSFEMGLLWPGLMGRYGDVLGLPFALEGLDTSYRGPPGRGQPRCGRRSPTRWFYRRCGIAPVSTSAGLLGGGINCGRALIGAMQGSESRGGRGGDQGGEQARAALRGRGFGQDGAVEAVSVDDDDRTATGAAERVLTGSVGVREFGVEGGVLGTLGQCRIQAGLGECVGERVVIDLVAANVQSCPQRLIQSREGLASGGVGRRGEDPAEAA